MLLDFLTQTGGLINGQHCGQTAPPLHTVNLQRAIGSQGVNEISENGDVTCGPNPPRIASGTGVCWGADFRGFYGPFGRIG